MLETKRPKKQPWWASDHLWGRMKGVITCPLLGVWYEIPITEDSECIADLLRGEENPWKSLKKNRKAWDRSDRAERGMRDVISAILVQVRETEVASAAQMMAQDIQQKLDPVIREALRRSVKQAAVKTDVGLIEG